MPHEFESGVFTEGKAAWHGLGTVLPNSALDSAEALEYSGLAGWQLAKQPVYVGNQENGFGRRYGSVGDTRIPRRTPVGTPSAPGRPPPHFKRVGGERRKVQTARSEFTESEAPGTVADRCLATTPRRWRWEADAPWE